MTYLNNKGFSKSVYNVLKHHITAQGKFYRLEVLSCCHTSVPPNESHKRDLIGPPHPLSNLRPVQFHVTENEAPIERRFRLKRQEVQQWNQDFWTKHNTSFVKERKEFMAANQPQNSETPLSPDEMSVFYKAFLDKNWRTHLDYNVEWYRRNAQLVLMHLWVKLYQARNRLSLKKTAKEQPKP